MARPRVFISSTFYDLRQVRSDLESFMRDIGYEPVLFERGQVTYTKQNAPEEDCYRSVADADMLIALIGGKYGTGGSHHPYSISQQELKTAHRHNKQVYVFIEHAVHVEYSTYTKNKHNADVEYFYADDARIYSFIEELYALPSNNPIFTFTVARDIIATLREQWAGLFQRLLQGEARSAEVSLIQKLTNTASTLGDLVGFLTEERRATDHSIHMILLNNHPAFSQLQSMMGVAYRVYFTTSQELDAWLTARSMRSDPPEPFDDDDALRWRSVKNPSKMLRVDGSVFDDQGRLRVYTVDEWNPAWLQMVDQDVASQPDPFGDG